MTIIEIPLWMVITFVVCFLILFIHVLVGDFLGKIIYQHFKEQDDEEKKYKKLAQFLEWYKKKNELEKADHSTTVQEDNKTYE